MQAAATALTGALTASQLQGAYGVTSAASTAGTGETVAIVDAYRDPTIVSDLATYRSNNGLPACDSSTGAGCLTVYNQNGAVINPATASSPGTPPDTTSDDEIGWETETSLDVDMVSAICPNCSIALVEANSPYIYDLGAAENSAAKVANFVSNSWGGGDSPGESADDNAYFNHPGKAIVFSGGDAGYGAEYPASSQFVTSVGGTYLDESSTSGPWTQVVWNGQGPQSAGYGTAAGCSAGEPQPSWGTDSGDSTASTLCANRTQNDVSAAASSPYGIGIYSSMTDSAYSQYSCGGTCAQIGTSVAAPIITAMYALAGNPAANTYPASYLYQDPSGLTPVTSGTDVLSSGYGPFYSPINCESNRQYLCNAADRLSTPYSGYNGPAGLGTPNGNLSPFKNNATGNVVSLPNPGTYDLQQATSVTLPALKAIDSASGQTITYSASGLPAGLSINSSTGVISGKVTYVENDTVKVTAKDSTGASATVAFRIEASGSMTSDYHWAGVGHAQVDVSNKCMDDNGNSSNNGTKIQIWTCTSGDAGQNFLFQPDTAPGQYANDGLSQLGTIRIHSKCLNIVNNGTANGSKIQLWSCNGGANEEWEITGFLGQLYNPQSGKCLEDPGFSTTNGKQLDIWTCKTTNTNTNNQNWLLPASPFESAVSGKCINAAGNSTANGTKIISYSCNSGSNEKLGVLSTTGGYTYLWLNGKCLNAKGNGTVNGTAVVLYNCTDSSGDVPWNSMWFFTAYGQIENDQSQKCLAIPNNSTANGTALVLEDCYGEPGEVWAAS